MKRFLTFVVVMLVASISTAQGKVEKFHPGPKNMAVYPVSCEETLKIFKDTLTTRKKFPLFIQDIDRDDGEENRTLVMGRILKVRLEAQVLFSEFTEAQCTVTTRLVTRGAFFNGSEPLVGHNKYVWKDLDPAMVEYIAAQGGV